MAHGKELERTEGSADTLFSMKILWRFVLVSLLSFCMGAGLDEEAETPGPLAVPCRRPT
jgi:hypothetical protein